VLARSQNKINQLKVEDANTAADEFERLMAKTRLHAAQGELPQARESLLRSSRCSSGKSPPYVKRNLIVAAIIAQQTDLAGSLLEEFLGAGLRGPPEHRGQHCRPTQYRDLGGGALGALDIPLRIQHPSNGQNRFPGQALITNDPALLPLFTALSRYGPNWLLWVVPQDTDHPPGTVE
jgi:hypothetical protein